MCSFKGTLGLRMYAECQAMACMLVMAWCKLLHMFMPFHAVGQLLISVWRMLASDVTKWMCIFGFFLISFSSAIR